MECTLRFSHAGYKVGLSSGHKTEKEDSEEYFRFDKEILYLVKKRYDIN